MDANTLLCHAQGATITKRSVCKWVFFLGNEKNTTTFLIAPTLTSDIDFSKLYRLEIAGL